MTFQDTNRGRLVCEAGKTVTVTNYLSVTYWFGKQGLTSVSEGIRSNTPILVCMIGAQTALPDEDLPHESIGVAGVIHLGLIPTILDIAITTTTTELNHHYMRDRLPAQPELDLSTILDHTKNLIKARALGIHRLITSENRAFRRHLQDQYGIRPQRKRLCPKKTLIGQPIKPLNPSENKSDSKSNAPSNTARRLTLCKGKLCSRIQQNSNLTGDTAKRSMSIPQHKSQCYKRTQF